MTDKEKADEEVVKTLLNTEPGKVLVEWMKRKSGFDLPVFDSTDTTGHVARLRDGGRQLVCEVLNLKES